MFDPFIIDIVNVKIYISFEYCFFNFFIFIQIEF